MRLRWESYSDFGIVGGKIRELFPPFCTLCRREDGVYDAHEFGDDAINDAAGVCLGQRAFANDITHSASDRGDEKKMLRWGNKQGWKFIC